jgi:hypothetical protein
MLEPFVKPCIALLKKLYKCVRKLKTIDEVEEYFPGFKAFMDSAEQEIPRPKTSIIDIYDLRHTCIHPSNRLQQYAKVDMQMPMIISVLCCHIVLVRNVSQVRMGGGRSK